MSLGFKVLLGVKMYIFLWVQQWAAVNLWPDVGGSSAIGIDKSFCHLAGILIFDTHSPKYETFARKLNKDFSHRTCLKNSVAKQSKLLKESW